MCISTAVNAQLALQVNMSQQKIRENNPHGLFPTGVGSPIHIPVQTPYNQNIYPFMQGYPPYIGTPMVAPPSYLHTVQQPVFAPVHLMQPQRVVYPNQHNVPTHGMHVPAPPSHVNNMGQPMGPMGWAGTASTILPGVPHPPSAPIPPQFEQTHVNRSSNVGYRILRDGNAAPGSHTSHTAPSHGSSQHPGHGRNENPHMPTADNLMTVHPQNGTATSQSDRVHQNKSNPLPNKTTPPHNNDIIVIPTSPIMSSPKVSVDRSENAPSPSYSLSGECSDKNGQGSTDTPYPHPGDEAVINCGNQSDIQTEPVNYVKGDHPHFRIPSLSKAPPDCQRLLQEIQNLTKRQ